MLTRVQPEMFCYICCGSLSGAQMGRPRCYFVSLALIVAGAFSLGTNQSLAKVSQNRQLIVFSSSESDANFVGQTEIIDRSSKELADRDVVIVKAVGSGQKARLLRHRYDVTDVFRA